jgi:hypothetical protein
MLTDHTRKTVQAVLVAVFVAWISFGSWYSWQLSKSPHAPTKRQTAKQTDEKAAHYNPFYEFWQWTTHDAVSFYTFVLAIFTGVLGSVAIVQIRYLIRADKTARVAADAAKKSADATTAIESPYLLVKITSAGLPIERGSKKIHLKYAGAMKYKFVNHGRTPAILKEIYCKFDQPDRFPEPIDVSKTGGTQMPGGTIVEAAKESDEYALPFMGTISEDPMIIATNPCYFLGFVKYTDIFNNDITTGFCFLYHAPGEYFLVGGDQYNYRKQERKKDWSGGLSEP